MEEEEKKQPDEYQEERHILFETDDYVQALINAAWFGKKMPSRRQVQMESRAQSIISTRRGAPQAKEAASKKTEDGKPTLAMLRDAIMNIESLYTDSGLEL